ncbi:MAG: substrate-binding domain-containing protein [Muribaculaceae bacterium]|nr:substrate-binding domain-containing protein [Roseburia sp.]MCM1431447.1 substrate-binding domain-containing protein [Muribaculaceae bacterium]MCM1493259.1 substrate-binding domain-containing protein [Muribaculaceae bacterium]
MPTIKEIAELAGVSRGTVDRVLNNRGSVNPATAQRVREIAERLHYQPNKAGLMLAAQKKNIKIGVVLFSDSNPLFKELLEGISAKQQELAGYNCSLLMRQTAFDEMAQFSAMEELLKAGIHGLVITPCSSPYIAAEIDRYTDLGIPVITVNTDIASKRMAYVGDNSLRSGQTAAGLMGRMTFGEIHTGIVTGSSRIQCHTERLTGFTRILEQSYPRIHVAETIENHDDDVESFEKVKTMLEAHPEINALYFAAGGIYGGCQAVQSLQRADSMQIITHDCVPATAELLCSGVITATICQQPYRQGYLPVELLSRYLLEGIAPEQELNYVDIDIRIKENL